MNSKSKWRRLVSESDDAQKAELVKSMMEFNSTIDDLGWRERQAKREEFVSGIVDELLETHTMEELAAEWFKDYGCMNGWGSETSAEYAIACGIHDRDIKEHPENHKSYSREPYRCYHVSGCSCGLVSSCDSSD